MATRIGLVIGQLHRGGAEKQLTALAVGLRRDHAMRPVVYCLSDLTEPYGSELQRQDVDLRSFPLQGISKWSRPLQLARAFRDDGVEMVQAFLMGPTLHAALANLRCGLPFVVSFRWGPHDCPAWRRMLHGWAHRRADAVTVNSRASLEFVERAFGVAPKRLSHIANGVDFSSELPDREVARAELGIAPGAPVILGVARLASEKNLPLFVQVAASALASRPEGVCMLAGAGPEMERLRSRVADTGQAQQFRILGLYDQVPRLLAAADLFLTTSDIEGTPNAVLEAMVAGLPVVATAVGDLPFIVREGESGFLLPQGDRDGLAEACARLLDDPSTSARFGQAGARFVRREFSTARMVAAYAEIYRGLTH